ncbi:MAG: hypothetical protein OWS03_03790, partial [Alicyclobacillaceae bacterium]|nr:hypothetical protein [Alicyclobacillaceae bacterium]
MSKGTSLVTLGLVVCMGGFLVAWRVGALKVTIGPNDQPTTQAAQTIRKLAQEATQTVTKAVNPGHSGSQESGEVTVATVPEKPTQVQKKEPSFRTR